MIIALIIYGIIGLLLSVLFVDTGKDLVYNTAMILLSVVGWPIICFITLPMIAIAGILVMLIKGK
jgi:hypothetical protein